MGRPALPFAGARRFSTLLSGNVGGLKASQLKQIEALGKRSSRAESLVTPELAKALCAASHEVQRQIGLLIDRRGRVTNVVVGDAHTVFLPEFPRRGKDRLCGLRLVHTHLKDTPLNEDDLTDLALLRLDCIAAICLESDGLPGPVYWAHILPANDNDTPWEELPKTRVHDLPEDFTALVRALETEFARVRGPRGKEITGERAILVHVSQQAGTQSKDSLDELRELTRSAGIDVADTLIQRRKPDPKFVLGKGRLKLTLIKAMQLDAEVLIFDDTLTPSQLKAMAQFTDLKILDRTQVILDIFAQHATSREGKLQVELAQLRYRQPFLGMSMAAFSRLSGGIGGRGPGETKLEVDRSRARQRIARLEREVRTLGARRELRRSKRTRKGVPVVSVVGYTNAGKSTLLNQLTQSDVIAQDALFATLNPVSRRLRFPQEREVIVTDTVGFIRELPAELMDAFRTTFEELHDSDLLLHVMDASAPDVEQKFESVTKLLAELNLNQKTTYCVLNKIDRCDPHTVSGLAERYRAIPVCALDRSTFTPLLDRMEAELYSGDMLPQ